MNFTDSARETVASAIREFGSNLAVLSSFQREDVIVTDLVLNAAPGTRVLTLDTGRLPVATLQMIADIEKRYSIQVVRLEPDPREVESMISLHGAELFRENVPNRMLCCDIRKSRPLARGLSGLRAYFTGLRRAQAKSRATIEVFDRSAPSVKISPLADWTTDDVVRYTRENRLPEHSLYTRGYTSIGCDPCTRPVVAGEDERAGRWWWEVDAVKECGLHFSADGRAERTVDVLLREVLAKASSRASMTHEGFTVWLTGMSGAGKSTLAGLLNTRLREGGAKVEMLDGDVARARLSPGLGFSREDRDAHIRRIGFISELLSRNGVIVVVAAISPYRKTRDEVKGHITHFVEVFVDCPIAVLAERDVKGLYKRALAGDLAHFTGISDPYEAPLAADVVVHSDRESAEESLDRIWREIERRGLIRTA